MSQDNQRILDLCRKVSTEKDGNKMTELIRQLNAELDKVNPKKVPETSNGKQKELRRA